MMGVFGGVGILGTLVYLALAAGLVTVGLTHVRKVSSMSGLCLAGVGALEGFMTLLSLISTFLYSLIGPGIMTVTALVGLLTGLLSGGLLLASIYFLAGALKQAPPPQNQGFGGPGYGPPGYGPPGGGPGYGPPPGYGPGPGGPGPGY